MEGPPKVKPAALCLSGVTDRHPSYANWQAQANLWTLKKVTQLFYIDKLVERILAGPNAAVSPRATLNSTPENTGV